ncbi:MAG: filamentous hemagglutinin N-terminal domain-containing protein [Methylohalobius sp. ZOD2]
MRDQSHRRFHSSVYPLFLLLTVYSVARAEVVVDDSFGPARTLAGPDFRITPDLGRRAGNNLFHSFDRFDIDAGQSATFSGPDSVENILSRVTGGSPSHIDGLLRSTIAGADLFFINPAGLVFGPNAALDVSGSFHVGTADFIRLADGARFNARPSTDDALLSTAPPEAFGFLSKEPAPVSLNDAQLQGAAHKTLSIVGGDIKLTGSGLTVEQGRVNLASLGSPGEMTIAALDTESFSDLGEIKLAGGQGINVNGAGGGEVVIRAGRFTVENTVVQAATLGDGESGGIDIDARDSVTVEGSILGAGSFSTGTGGDVTIRTDTLTISAGGFLDSGSFSPDGGDAGNIDIVAREAHLAGPAAEGFSIIGTTTSGSGKGGDVALRVQHLTLEGGAEVNTSTFGQGNGGNIVINESQSVRVSGTDGDGNPSALISNAFGRSAPGRTAGDITIDTSELTVMQGRVVTRTEGDGDAGNIELTVDRLFLREGGQVFSGTGDIENGVFTGTGGPGAGGNIRVTADASVEISGRDRKGFQSGLFSNAQFGSGDAGSLSVASPVMRMEEGLVLSNASPESRGNAGAITLKVPVLLSMDRESEISSNTRAAGDAGNITVEVGELSIRNGSQIDASTFSKGRGGVLTVDATGDIRITGRPGEQVMQTGFFAVTNQEGIGGSIHVRTAGTLNMRGGRILTRTLANADSGGISIAAKNLVLADGAQIFSGIGNARPDGTVIGSPEGEGKGGDIRVTVAETLSATGADPVNGFSSGIFSDAQTGQGGAGAISVEAGRIEMSREGGIRASTSTRGRGGNVEVHGREIILDERAFISARSFATDSETQADPDAGKSGDIDIAARDTLRLRNRSAVTVETEEASAGDITLNAGFLVDLQDQSRITTSVAGGRGDGGNITIDPVFVVLDDGSRIIAQAREGAGGNIRIVSDFFFASPDSVVDASSDFGIDGTVNIDSPDTNISGSIVVLPASFMDASALLSERCGARAAGELSSFVLVGRGGLPLAPEDLTPAFYQALRRSTPTKSQPRAGGPKPRPILLKWECGGAQD